MPGRRQDGEQVGHPGQPEQRRRGGGIQVGVGAHRAGVDAGYPHRAVGRPESSADGLGMPEGDHGADAGAEVGGGLAGEHQSAGQAAGGQPGRPGGTVRQYLGGHVDRTAVAADRSGDQQPGLHLPGLGQGAHPVHYRPGRRVVGVQRHGDPAGRGAQQPGGGVVQGGAEGVEQADDRDQGGDGRGDAEQGEGGTPRRTQHVAQRDLVVAAAGQPEPHHAEGGRSFPAVSEPR